LSKGNIKPHKIAYYIEKRDPEFETKMANVLQVYKEISLINEGKMRREKQTTGIYWIPWNTWQGIPDDWKIRIILDNHSSHFSKETKKYLLTKPGRFKFVLTPKHDSWLNMIEMFFSKIARSFLKKIRIENIEELKESIYKGIEAINDEPVIFRWKYKKEDIDIVWCIKSRTL